MKLLAITFLSFFFDGAIQFTTLGSGSSLILAEGVNWVSIECADCDVIIYGDTMNVTSVFTFPDYPLENYKEIRINSNAADTKIAYRYENY